MPQANLNDLIGTTLNFVENSELREQFGVPSRPQGAQAQRWDDVYGKPFKYVPFEGSLGKHRGSQHIAVPERSGARVENSLSLAWAGSVVEAGSNKFNDLIGFIQVPTATAPGGAAGTFVAGLSVALGGYTGSGEMLSAGVNIDVTNGQARTHLFYQYGSVDPTLGPEVAPGELIQSVVAWVGNGTARATMLRLSTAEWFHQEIAAPDLNRRSAEWILNRRYVNGELARLPDLSCVYVPPTVATYGASGTTILPSAGTLYDIFQDNRVATATSVTSTIVGDLVLINKS